MCTNECGIRVHVSNGRVVDVEGWPEHPFSRGHICVKARQIPAHVYHEARLKHPLRKKSGGWQRISWDEALESIAAKLSDSKERFGAGSLGVLVGEPVEVAHELGCGPIWRFCDAYGTPNRFHTGDLCCMSLMLAQMVTLGATYDPDPENANFIVVWADNPRDTAAAVHRKILDARRRGAKLAVIDPRRITLCEQADLHLRPRLGTDGILLLAMLNVIISEGLYDREFVARWTVGFDRLAEHVASCPPEDAAGITGVPADNIRQLARLYATTKPACVQYGFKLHQCHCGFQNSRSLAILQAITGNLQVPGGDLQRFSLRRKPARICELGAGPKHPAAERFPLYSAFHSSVDGCMTNWADVVLGEPQQVRNMIISGANPAITWPNTTRVRKALAKLDFLVVMDVLLTDTAQIYEPSGLSVQKIEREHPDGYLHSHVLPGNRQYKEKGFKTPSGKVELYSEQLAQLGHEPLPTYVEPPESPISTPEIFREYPLLLTTGTREKEYYHSEHRHLERLRQRNPSPTAQIHPETAAQYGVRDGKPMIVETTNGRLEIEAWLSDDILPGMVSVPHGWPEAPENCLTDDAPADPVSGFVAFTSLLCRVRPGAQATG